jgi:hypothetical protein
MALSASTLATQLASALGIDETDYTTAYAEGLIASLTAATFAHALVTGGAPSSGGSLISGAASGGILTISSSPMEAITSSQFSTSPQITTENQALITYIGTATVVFSAGNIIGSCTNTPTSPGALAAGAGTNGTLTGITGAGAYSAVQAAWPQIGPLGSDFYDALINYILANAVCSYAPGSVTAVCPAGGGAITGGVGVGGIIT